MKKINPVVHFEMPYVDVKRVSKFYSSAFGWNMNDAGVDMGHYVIAITTEVDKNRMPKTPGAINGGFYTKKEDWPDQYPSVVIAVDNINESIGQVKEAGGSVLGEPNMIPGIGLYVSFFDTEGNRVSMLQPLMNK